MALDRSSIEGIRGATFPASWVWRGYDKAEVEKFLDELADWLADNFGDGADRKLTDSELRAHRGDLDTLEARIKELERELGDADRRERKLASRLRETEQRLKATRKRPAQRKPAARAPARRRKPTARPRIEGSGASLDINRASFEDLRQLGLSVTDCARVVAYREVGGGYDSLDILDELQGLSEDEVRELKAKLVAGPLGDRS